MAKITKDTVKHLARLAHISLNDKEITQFERELAAILEYVEQLQRVDTKKVKPTSQVTGLTNVTRPDTVKDYQVGRDELLKSAPDQQEGYIKVKRVL